MRKDSAEVTDSSNVSATEIIQLAKLQRYANDDLFVNIVSVIKSVKPSLWLAEGRRIRRTGSSPNI